MPIKSNTLKLSINREYDIKLYTSNKCTQFQNGILIFGCAITEIPGKANDVTSLNVAFLGFLTVVCQNKRWNSEHKAGRDRYFYFEI